MIFAKLVTHMAFGRFFCLFLSIAAAGPAFANNWRQFLPVYPRTRNWSAPSPTPIPSRTLCRNSASRVDRLAEPGLSQETFLNRFSAFTDRIQTGDTVIFYFSGHGVGLGGANYFIPSDIPKNLASPQLLKARAIAEADVISAVQARKAINE